jgi:uncharacterized protein YwqG
VKILLILLGLAGLVIFTRIYLRSRRTPKGPVPGPEGSDDRAPEVASVVDPLRRPGVLLRSTDGASTSYLGGSPPAYPGFAWPERKGLPLGFVGCVDLSQVTTIDWLPKTGLLSFFYDFDQTAWGFDPKDRGAWRVDYVPDASLVTGVAEAPATLPSESRLPRRAVTLTPASIPPPWDRSPLAEAKLPDDERERAWKALDAIREEVYGGRPKHQMGGWPEPVQGADMDLECQLASNGIYVGDPSGYQDPRAAALRPGAADWRLLLQVDSDDDLKVMWGDLGMIYFWVREADARAGDFRNAWLVLQCH